MNQFTQLFGQFLSFVYHCFDRIVIQGYLPLLTREEHIVHLAGNGNTGSRSTSRTAPLHSESA
jgi:hypothetical protein